MLTAPPVCWNVEFHAIAPDTIVYDWKIVVAKTGYVMRHGRATVRPDDTKTVRVCTNGYKPVQATARWLLPGKVTVKIRRAR